MFLVSFTMLQLISSEKPCLPCLPINRLVFNRSENDGLGFPTNVEEIPSFSVVLKGTKKAAKRKKKLFLRKHPLLAKGFDGAKILQAIKEKCFLFPL